MSGWVGVKQVGGGATWKGRQGPSSFFPASHTQSFREPKEEAEKQLEFEFVMKRSNNLKQTKK